MADRKKVLIGLECCTHGVDKCAICPYDPRYNKIDEINARSCMTQLAMDALELLKAQEPVKPMEMHWIHCKGKSNVWYCSRCGEKINYNNAHRVYKKDAKPIEQVNRFCRGCGYKAVKWDG